MKKLSHSLSLLLLISLFGITTNSGLSQGSPMLGKFSGDQQGTTVSLYWQMLAGSTCNGIQIYRSTDSLNFVRIGYIPGICGHEFEESNYYFTDTLPLPNAINYYYLELGTIGVSDVISVNVISSGSSGYQIRPHPVVDRATIYFDPLSTSAHEIRIYDMQGIEVFYEKTTDNFFEIESSSIPSGSYAFKILSVDGNDSVKGVMIVQH
jgi:hypothetical protein